LGWMRILSFSSSVPSPSPNITPPLFHPFSAFVALANLRYINAFNNNNNNNNNLLLEGTKYTWSLVLHDVWMFIH